MKQNLRYFLWNAGYRLAGSNDGLPIPPTHLVRLVAPRAEIAWFLRSGRVGQECILYTLQRNGLRMEDLETVLDFGCGCGRIMRHWQSLKGPRLFGTDYNPLLIGWCQKNLGGFAEFQTNQLTPPLDYPDGQFHLIYVFSVFTHLTEELQSVWFEELRRVLKLGGFLLATLHGLSRLSYLSLPEQQKFRAGEMVTRQEGLAGTNICGAYHPESYVRTHLARSFEVIDHMDAGARDINQDIYLFKKPGGQSG